MANNYGVANTTFKPFSFEEMLKPVLMATEAHQKREEELNTLLEDAALKAFNFMDQDTAEKSIYDIDYQKSVVVIGNEANGITKDTAENSHRRVTIPMKGRAESLNAAAAAAVLIWEFLKN